MHVYGGGESLESHVKYLITLSFLIVQSLLALILSYLSRSIFPLLKSPHLGIRDESHHRHHHQHRHLLLKLTCLLQLKRIASTSGTNHM